MLLDMTCCCAGGMLIGPPIVACMFIWWFCCRGDCGFGRMPTPSILTCCDRGEVCGIDPCNDVSGMEYAGYPDAAAVAIAAACDGETPYGGCMAYAWLGYGGCIIMC